MSKNEVYRRTALILAGLDSCAIDAVIDRLPEQHAAAIRHELMTLDQLDPEEQNEAIAAFVARQETPEVANVSTPNVAPDRLMPPAGSALSDLLAQNDEAIAMHLYHERSSIAAALVNAFPKDRAAGTLRHLPAAMRSRVLIQLNLGVQTKSHVVEMLADRICDRQAYLDQGKLNASHQDALQAIMDELSPEERLQMLKDLEKENPLLARRLNPNRSRDDCYC